VWQILIGRKLLGTHHAFAHPVSELYNHPNGVGLAPFSRALWLVLPPPTLPSVREPTCYGINYTHHGFALGN
jgi:hypothetical protein